MLALRPLIPTIKKVPRPIGRQTQNTLLSFDTLPTQPADIYLFNHLPTKRKLEDSDTEVVVGSRGCSPLFFGEDNVEVSNEKQNKRKRKKKGPVTLDKLLEELHSCIGQAKKKRTGNINIISDGVRNVLKRFFDTNDIMLCDDESVVRFTCTYTRCNKQQTIIIGLNQIYGPPTDEKSQQLITHALTELISQRLEEQFACNVQFVEYNDETETSRTGETSRAE